MAEQLRESLGQVREDYSPSNVNERLEDAVSDRPLARHLLDLKVVAKALVIAAVLTLIVSLLLSPKLGALVLVVSFGGAWYFFAQRSYERRRPTKE